MALAVPGLLVFVILDTVALTMFIYLRCLGIIFYFVFAAANPTLLGFTGCEDSDGAVCHVLTDFFFVKKIFGVVEEAVYAVAHKFTTLDIRGTPEKVRPVWGFLF